MELSQNIILLTGDNWEFWRHEVYVLLLHIGAWQFVEQPIEESNTVEPLTESEKKVGEDAKPENDSLMWREQQNLKAGERETLYHNLSVFQPLISSITVGAEAWKIPCYYLKTTTRAHVIQLFDVIFNTRFITGENLGLFLSE